MAVDKITQENGLTDDFLNIHHMVAMVELAAFALPGGTSLI